VSAGLSLRVMARGATLCLVAGYVDAIGYTMLGGVFAANMTGNTVLLAIAASEGDAKRAGGYATTLAAFLAGATLSAFLRRTTGRPVAALLAAAALLLAAAVAHLPAPASLAILAVAMGLQGAAITRFGAAGMQTVVVTATIIRLADRIAARVAPRQDDAPGEAARLRRTCLDRLWRGRGARAACRADDARTAFPRRRRALRGGARSGGF
jgi:uncharacterized membrane protein YoaK (UPF0700 family)